MQYRPHIDGLRAVAIVPVVLFHAEVHLFTGGFTGVDVFFAISGFLITSIIVEEIDRGRFSLWSFYKRRALRILPAYLVMILGVVVASWFVLFPEETRSLGRQVAAASLFVSNILFWRSADYFDPDVHDLPLLHTWTLSVEEQYYLLLPVFLIIVARFLGRSYALALGAASLVSFAIAVWAVPDRATAAFYLLPTRAFEFGLGSLAAVMGLVGAGSAALRRVGALAGVVLVAAAIFLLDEHSAYPGTNALLPSVGAVLLVICAEGNLAGRILSSRPFVAVGRISYSLYLWHWPIIVFYRLGVGPLQTAADVAIVIGLSVVAAVLSTRFVEEPFRKPSMRHWPALRINAAAVASLAVAVVAGGSLFAGAERWGGHPDEVRRIASYIDYRSSLDIHPCLIHATVPGGADAFDPVTCLPPGDGQPTVLVMGDSFAEHLVPALEDALAGVTVQHAGSTGCTPTIRVSGDWYCPRVIRPVLFDHIPAGGVDHVVLSARWRMEDVEPLQETMHYLLEHVGEVTILGPSPEYLGSFPRILAQEVADQSLHLERRLDPEVRDLDRLMAAIDWGNGVRYVSLYDLVCPTSGCRLLTAERVPYLADYGHYTRPAAREIVDELAAMGIFSAGKGVDPRAKRATMYRNRDSARAGVAARRD